MIRGNRHSSRVAKIGPDVAAEWAAYKTIIAAEPSSLFPPIEAVTLGVLGEEEIRPGEPEAVVYSDVVQFGGGPAVNLEQVASAALSGDERSGVRVRAVIGTLFHLAKDVLYGDGEVIDTGNWEAMNPLLGPDLRLSGVQFDAGITADAPDLLPAEVMEMALDREGGCEPSAVTLARFSAKPAFGRHIAGRDNVTVDLGTAAPPGSFTIQGTIESRRSAWTWQRITEALPELTATGAEIQVGPTRAANPFAALSWLLTGRLHGLVTAMAHGDVNPRNVLVCAERPYLIDYASPSPDRPVHFDLAWLEINLMRRPVAGQLDFAGLVQLQRVLALADRIAALRPAGERQLVDEALLATLAASQPGLAAPYGVLSAIRTSARFIYPEHRTDAAPWWHAYQQQLALAAHHVFKWQGESQTGTDWRAELAAAAVATEQLPGSEGPWRLWSEDERSGPAAAVAPLVPGTLDGLAVLGDLVKGLDLSRRDAGATLSRELCRVSMGAISELPGAADRKITLGEAHDLYVDLRALDLGRIRRPPGEDQAGSVSAASDEAETQVKLAIDLAEIARQVVVTGGSGAGKTSFLDELERRCLGGLVPATRIPARVTAPELARSLIAGDDAVWRLLAGRALGGGPVQALFSIGAVHLLVDDFDKVLLAEERVAVAGWLNQVRREFSRVLVTICHRGTELPSELAGWRAMALLELNDQQIGQYLARHPAPNAGMVADLVLGSTADQALTSLARNPMLLSLLASVPGGDQVRTAGDLLDRYVATRDEPGTDPGWISDSERRAEELTSTGSSGFAVRIYQDYFAARVLRNLAAANPPGLMARVLEFGWRPAFALFVSFSTTGPETLSALVRSVADADPGFAALLLGKAANPPDELLRWFVSRQENVLADREAGQFALERAARALADLAADVDLMVNRSLFNAVADRAVQPAWRESCLTILAGACQAAPEGPRRTRLAGQLVRQAGELLTSADVPAQVRAAAARVIGDLRLHGVVTLIAGQISGEGPWLPQHEAWLALGNLGERLPSPRISAYQQARMTRLAEAERELLTKMSVREARQLQQERYELLRGLTGPDQLPELLSRRFAFELGDDLVSVLVDKAIAAQPLGQEPAEPRWRAILLGQRATAADLLAALDESDRLAALAAAHKLLRDEPDQVSRAFSQLAARESAEQIPIAAAMARRRTVDLIAVVTYFRAMLPRFGQPGRPGLESLVTLLHAIAFRDKAIGMRETWRAQHYLASRDVTERLRWPWTVAMGRFGHPPDELAAMLKSDDDGDVGVAIDALASAGFLLTGGAGRAMGLGQDVSDRFLRECAGAQGARPEGAELVRLLRAAATLALPESLTVLFAGGDSLAEALAGVDAEAGSVVALPRFGPIEVAPAAEALAAVGYLARLLPPDEDLAGEVRRFLAGFDLSGTHPSVATGRVIGLAYLGDWEQALEALAAGSGDRRLALVARNAIELWAVTPPEVIARWLADRLAGSELAREVTGGYEELKNLAEQRAGTLVPVSSG